MHVAIAPFTSPFVDLFSSVAHCLTANGHQVTFLNPDLYVRFCLQKQSHRCEWYGRIAKPEPFYTDKSPLVRYVQGLYEVADVRKVVHLKNRQYTKAKKQLALLNPDVVLFWNGQEAPELDACRQLSIPVFCLENGYFPNTLQMHRDGVNCMADIAGLSTNDFLRYRYDTENGLQAGFSLVSVQHSVLRRRLFRFFDENYFLFIKEAYQKGKREQAARRRFAQFAFTEVAVDEKKPFIFFPLQVNSDTQIVLNSPYTSMYHALEVVLPQLKASGMTIILKEHPQETELVDYSRFVDNRQVFLYQKCNLEALIDAASLVVTVNSSVGLQAIERYKKVILLGQSLYAHAPLAYTLDTPLHEIVADPISVDAVDSYCAHFRDHIFIQGSWRQCSATTVAAIARRVLNGLSVPTTQHAYERKTKGFVSELR